MRRTILALVVSASALAGPSCGEDETGGSLDGVLRYLPEDVSQALVISTDLGSDQWEALDAQLARGEFAPDPPGEEGDVLNTDPPDPRSIEDVIRQSLAENDPPISYEDEVAPLLGSDAVVAVVGPPVLSGDDAGEGALVVALDTGDADATRSVLERLGLSEQGEAEGATLFGDEFSGAYVALDGNVLVLAQGDGEDGAAIREALAKARGDEHLSEDEFNQALEGLPGDALLRVYGDLVPLLDTPEVAPLRQLPWVAALRSFGATATIGDDAVVLDAALNTDADGLTDADLPVPAGAQTPQMVRREGEIGGASADQSQTTSFLTRAAFAAFPDSRFVRDVARIEQELEIDFERDVLAQFNGPSASSITLDGEFAARSEVADPEALIRTMRRLAPDLGRLVQDLQALRSEGLVALFLIAPDAPIAPGVLEGSRIDVARIPGQDELYEISNLTPPGGAILATPVPDRIVFGVVDDVFVVASDEQRARDIASSPAEPPPGAVGGASIAAGDLSDPELSQDLAADLLFFDPGPLGELTASLEASTSELRGSARIELP